LGSISRARGDAVLAFLQFQSRKWFSTPRGVAAVECFDTNSVLLIGGCATATGKRFE
jgi:hypothetical protein